MNVGCWQQRNDGQLSLKRDIFNFLFIFYVCFWTLEEIPLRGFLED
jgi:hypothetical protein